jgi:hypothetical protein
MPVAMLMDAAENGPKRWLEVNFRIRQGKYVKMSIGASPFRLKIHDRRVQS